jgi:hypothetical protein
MMYGDQRAALLMLQKDGQTLAVIAEKAGDSYAVAAENDRLVPDGVPVDTQTWWIQDKNQDGHPYIWYDPDRETASICRLNRTRTEPGGSIRGRSATRAVFPKTPCASTSPIGARRFAYARNRISARFSRP